MGTIQPRPPGHVWPAPCVYIATSKEHFYFLMFDYILNGYVSTWTHFVFWPIILCSFKVVC